MRRSLLFRLLSLGICFAAVWFGTRGAPRTDDIPSAPPEAAALPESAKAWTAVAPGVFRSDSFPCAYALVEQGAALLIGAARGADVAALKPHGAANVELCLLTHHHRDTSARAAEFVTAEIPVRAPKASADLLLPEGVQKFWQTCVPELPRDREPVLRDRSFGLFSYLVHPVGIAAIDCSLEDGQTITWRGWNIDVLATPGHTPDHVAFVARKQSDAATEKPLLFCGDAFSGRGRMWSPYTTDWDHWTGSGLAAAAESLRKLANVGARLLLPEHGQPTDAPAEQLNENALHAEQAGFLKSYERFTKERLGDPPAYEYLAQDQVATAGQKPWARLSEHLFLTGNTYVLSSRDGRILVVDPFGPTIVEQIETLRKDQQLGPIETVLISHAHNDHYTGAFQLRATGQFEVWTLDRVADTIAEPFRICAPFVDLRPLATDRRLRDGEQVAWHEYNFQIGHFPGQSYFTMGVRTTIDGKSCYLTADNFFHADQFSGSGGWCGRNRGWPDLYAKSAQAVLDARPDWVLAEHGGAFVFNAEDFRRRVAWGEAAAKAMDALSPNGEHRQAWNPSWVQVEPLLQMATPDGKATATIVIENTTLGNGKLTVQVLGRGLVSMQEQTIPVPPQSVVRHRVQIEVGGKIPAGRHVFPLVVRNGDREDGGDAFFLLEVK